MITVYIPTYNRACFLREALTCLRLQTLARDHFRVIVADNASEDDTADVVRGFTDLNVVYVRRSSNIGEYRNWLGAAEFFDTPYFHFLSDDDLLAPCHLEFAWERLEECPKIDLFGAGHQYGGGLWESDLQRADLMLGDKYINADDMCCHWSREAWLAAHSICSAVSINACLFRTHVLQALHPLFESDIPGMPDRWFMARVGVTAICMTSPWPTCTLRVHGTNLVHGTAGETLDRASRTVAARVLRLAEDHKIDVIGFWQRYFLEESAARDDIRYLIHWCYPRDAAERALPGWRPRRGRLDCVPIPEPMKDWLRRSISRLRAAGVVAARRPR